MKKQLDLKAILDSDIEGILEKIGLLELVNQGKIKCEFCERKITLDNLYCIYVESNEFKFCCDRISCYEKLTKIQSVSE